MLYGLPASDFHDITTGSSTGSPNIAASPGYDLATGRGTPVANLIVAALAGQSVSNPPAPVATHFSVTAAANSTAGAAFTVTVTALDASGNNVTGYTGTVRITQLRSVRGLAGHYTFTSSIGGVAHLHRHLEDRRQPNGVRH